MATSCIDSRGKEGGGQEITEQLDERRASEHKQVRVRADAPDIVGFEIAIHRGRGGRYWDIGPRAAPLLTPSKRPLQSLAFGCCGGGATA